MLKLILILIGAWVLVSLIKIALYVRQIMKMAEKSSQEFSAWQSQGKVGREKDVSAQAKIIEERWLDHK